MTLTASAHRRTSRASWAARGTWGNAVVGVAVLGSAALGALTSSHRLIGLIIGALVGAVGVLVTDPLLVPVAAFPATLLIQRVGSGGSGSSVSISDLMVLFALAFALPKVHWEKAGTLRRALVPAAAYEALVLVTVIVHPNSHDSLEWAHRLVMLLGSLVVGWVVAASGRARQAVTALLVGCMVLAALALEHSVTLHFHAAQWGSYQKNYIGTTMWMAVIIAHLNPPWIAVPPWLARTAKYLCVLGLLASQSKQAIIALFVVAAFAAYRQPSVRRRSKFLLAALVPLLVAGYFILTAEIAQLPHNRFNSIATREASLSADLHVWLASPIFGQGMRWFYLPQFIGYIQPPDIFVEVLTETGVIGILALLVLLGGSGRLFLSLPRAIGTLAFVLVLGRAFEAIFDIYWVSAGITLPWLVAGLAIGAWDTALARGRQAPPSAVDGLTALPRP